MSKRKIVIATHGTLAEGFKSALQIIAGAENVEALKTYDFHLITNTSLGLLIDFILMEPDVETLKKKFDEKEFNAVYCNDFISNMTDIEDDL